VRPCTGSGRPPARYDHVVWIVMENKSFSSVMGAHSSAPFTRSLAAACGLAANFRAESHPSLPNYIAMTSGSTQGISDDSGPSSHRLGVPSIFSQLGTRWRALQESMPAPCSHGDASLYAVRHNPATYYTNLAGTCPRQDVRLGHRLDLSASFTFITPNLCHDTHDCGVSTGDRYLAQLVPRIVRSGAYRAGRTALFITWDEDDGSADNHIATLVLSRHTRSGTRSALRFNHYSLLGTTEEMLGLSRLGAAARAPSMRAAFGL
jgi:phosphatidylinositol-3-phosphatase